MGLHEVVRLLLTVLRQTSACSLTSGMTDLDGMVCLSLCECACVCVCVFACYCVVLTRLHKSGIRKVQSNTRCFALGCCHTRSYTHMHVLFITSRYSVCSQDTSDGNNDECLNATFQQLPANLQLGNCNPLINRLPQH